MAWYCGYCARWNVSEHVLCPYCARSARGRICRRCKEKVPSGARCCPHCGGERLIESALRQARLPLWTRLLGVVVIVVLVCILVKLLLPLVMQLVGWLICLGWRILVGLAIFWLATGLLPLPWGQRVRSVAWRLIAWFFRYLGRLVT